MKSMDAYVYYRYPMGNRYLLANDVADERTPVPTVVERVQRIASIELGGREGRDWRVQPAPPGNRGVWVVEVGKHLNAQIVVEPT